jgi:hypothetical protein
MDYGRSLFPPKRAAATAYTAMVDTAPPTAIPRHTHKLVHNTQWTIVSCFCHYVATGHSSLIKQRTSNR